MKRKSSKKVSRHLVYQVIGSPDGEVFFAEKSWANQLPRIRAAMKESRTWGEFRASMPRKDYSFLIQSFDRDGEPRPKGSDPFDPFQLPTLEDSPYPWPTQETERVLPPDILQKWGKDRRGEIGCWYWCIPESNLSAVLRELQKREIAITRRDGDDLLDG